MLFTVYSEETGKVARSGYSTVPELQAQSGEAVLLGMAESTGYVTEGEYHPLGDIPSAFHTFDYVNKVWVLDLLNAKTQAKERITKARNLEEASSFTAYGKVFDSDFAAIQRISVAVQAATIVGESFSIVWTCQDNSTLELDYAQTLALPAFMAAAANTLHIKARALKDNIDSASTLEEIEAITW